MVPADRSAEPVMVGPYRLIQRLGEGGMGVVHLALDPDGKAVAIKVLRPHIASDPEARLRLEREVATLRRIQHPQIAAVIDADVDGDVPYLVTAFVPGQPLDAYVKEHGPLPRGHVARIGSVLAGALRSLHAAGIVHRDVKPANVMLLDGDPVLIDFGIAHLADESRITHTGLVMGTPGYLSPEIVGGEEVSPATDWWGWGATLAYTATGRPPFGTGPIEVVLDRVRRGASDLDGIDDGLKATLTQALSVDPERRPAPEVLVAGLAAAPPPRPVIDLTATGPVGTTASSPVRPGDRTVPREPAAPAWNTGSATGQAQDATISVPPPDEAALRSTARTDPTPPPPDWRGGWTGQPSADQTEVLNPVNGFGDRTRIPAYAGPPPASSYPPAAPDSGRWSSGTLVDDASQQAVRAPEEEQPGPTWGDRMAQPIDPAAGSRGVLAGVLVVLCLVAAVAPQAAITIVWLLLASMRVVDRSNTSLLLRRQQFGPRSGDAVRVGLGVPWHFLLSLISSLFLLILPVLIGISVVFIAAAALAGNPDQSIPSGPGSLAAGMAAVLLTAWAGPGGGAVRRGARLTVRRVVTTRRAQLIVWAVIGMIGLAAVMVTTQQAAPDWGPWQGTWLVRQLSR